MHTRGQAALEFLSTYGFAFLIILVMIGALSYFGVLSPNKLIPSRCSFPPELNCFEFQIIKDPAGHPAGSAQLNVVLINQLGNTIDFNNADGTYLISSQFGMANGTSTGDCAFNPASIVGGGRTTLNCNITQAPPGGSLGFPAKGEKVKVAVDIQYKELGKSYWIPARGEILGTLV